MNATSRLLLAVLIATGITTLAGCASHPELRPYTAAETRELALESLAREGLSYDEFQRRKVQVLRGQGQVEGVVDAAPVLNQAPRVKG